MPASEKNKQNLRDAVNQAYEENKAKNPDRMKNLAKKVISNNTSPTSSEPTQKPKKSREENRAAVQRTLELMRKQKGQ